LSLGAEKTDLFLVSYAFLVVSTVVVLSYLSVTQIDVYVSGFAIEYFIVVLATAPHSSEELRRQWIIGIMLLIVFAGIVIGRVLQLLT
jgi:hypothetical protein